MADKLDFEFNETERPPEEKDLIKQHQTEIRQGAQLENLGKMHEREQKEKHKTPAEKKEGEESGLFAGLALGLSAYMNNRIGGEAISGLDVGDSKAVDFDEVLVAQIKKTGAELDKKYMLYRNIPPEARLPLFAGVLFVFNGRMQKMAEHLDKIKKEKAKQQEDEKK